MHSILFNVLQLCAFHFKTDCMWHTCHVLCVVLTWHTATSSDGLLLGGWTCPVLLEQWIHCQPYSWQLLCNFADYVWWLVPQFQEPTERVSKNGLCWLETFFPHLMHSSPPNRYSCLLHLLFAGLLAGYIHHHRLWFASITGHFSCSSDSCDKGFLLCKYQVVLLSRLLLH